MSSSGKEKLSVKAYKGIRHLIITLELKPGVQIEESYLEEKLEIGRTPVREALQRLHNEKLLDVIPGKGFFVRPISIDDVKSIFEAMTLIEQSLAQLAALRIEKDTVAELREISSEHKKALFAKEFLQAAALNRKLHDTYSKAADNQFLSAALEALNHQTDRLSFLTFTREARPVSGGKDYNALAIKQHEDLIDCFEKRDVARAKVIIGEHYSLFFLRVCLYMEPLLSNTSSDLPDYFFDKKIQTTV